MTQNHEKAIFGAGCFWHIEEYFSNVPGVISTKVGYACGKTSNPNYEEVCAGKTGHIEVVEVTFNSKKITYPELIRKFWKIHDPTSLDRQGPDIGTQYKSAICVTNKLQKEIAIKEKQAAQHKFKDKLVTVICDCSQFYLAEKYHQKYLKKKQDI